MRCEILLEYSIHLTDACHSPSIPLPVSPESSFDLDISGPEGRVKGRVEGRKVSLSNCELVNCRGKRGRTPCRVEWDCRMGGGMNASSEADCVKELVEGLDFWSLTD